MKSSSLYRARTWLGRAVPLVILTLYAMIALFPIVMILMNSFKAKKAIFGAPFAFPTSETFSLIGYETVTERATFSHLLSQQRDRHICGPAFDPAHRRHGSLCLVRV